MSITFKAAIWFWKGPAPWYFTTVPDDVAEEIKDISSRVSYGWGMIPVTARIGKTSWYTAMFPKDGSYVLPIKSAVRKVERLGEGDEPEIQLEIGKSG